MNRSQIYYLICKILFSDSDIGYKDSVISSFISPFMNWPMFISIGSNHLVLQTLYQKLHEQNLEKYMPPDVCEHLKYIYDLNCKRNNDILNQVKNLNNLFGKHGIIPLYMKGIGNIIDGVYNSTGERIMHDIDLLVTEDQWQTAANLLRSEGYNARETYIFEKDREKKHFPPLSKPGLPAAVEIHRLPVDYNCINVLETNDAFKSAKYITSPYHCYVFGDKHKIIHNFIHSQITHNGQIYARVYLRNLYDLHLLAKRDNPYKILNGLNKYRKQAAGYLKIYQKSIGKTTPDNHGLMYSGWLYAFRHELNLHKKNISIGTFFAYKIYLSYIKTPFKAIFDRELRNSLIKKISDVNWYKEHFNAYKKIYAIEK